MRKSIIETIPSFINVESLKFSQKGKSLEFSQAFEFGLNYWQKVITYLRKVMNR